MSGLDHIFERTKDFGLTLSARPRCRCCRWASGRSRSTRSTCSARTARSPTAACCMPRQMISTILDDDGKTVWPTAKDTPKGKRVVSAEAAYIVTDILAGNTDTKVNPFWGKWAIYDGKTRRPAAYKTGTTSDNRDVAAYGYLAPPKDKKAPGPRGRRLDGQQRQHPERRQALARHVGAALVGDPDRGQPRARRSPSSSRRPALETATVDAFTGLKPGPFTTKTVKELFLQGTVPTEKETIRVAAVGRRGERPAVAGRLRRPRVTRGLLRPLRGRVQLPGLAEGERGMGRPRGHAAPVSAAARRARERPTSTTAPSPRSGGPGARRSRRRALCPLYTPPVYCDPFAAARSRCRRPPTRASRCPTDPTGGDRTPETVATTPQAREPTADAAPRAAQSSTIVAPSPPSPRSPGRSDFTSGWPPAAARTASRRAPVPMAVDDQRPCRGRPAPRRRGSGRARRAPRRRGRRAGRATRRRTARGRAAARPRSMSAPTPGAVPTRASASPPPSGGSRSSTSTVTRIPPASSVARLPPRSSAAIRPSQPPDRLRARSPSRQRRSHGRARGAGRAVLAGRAAARARPRRGRRPRSRPAR